MAGIHKLTAASLRINEQGRYADGGGLYLQVTPGAAGPTRSWLFRYMLDGNARQMGLGPTHTITLAEAREQARELRKLLKDKIDPIEHRLAEHDARRAEKAAAITFKDAATNYIKVHESGWRNPKHRAQWRSTLATYIYPTLGNRPIAAIDAAVINATLAPIWTEKAETATRVKQRVERIVQWVKDGMPLPTPGKAKRVKHHAALPYVEIPAFMAELRDRASVSAKALEFTILTAVRTTPTIGARWEEIDFKAKVWTVPADRMKAGAKDFRVPLSDRAIAILNEAKREDGNPYIFIGGVKGQGLSNMAMLNLLKDMTVNGYTVHGFRSSFRDWTAERTNYPNEVAEMALAHTVKGETEKAYRRGDMLERRRPLMTDWAKFCESKPLGVAEATPLHAARR